MFYEHMNVYFNDFSSNILCFTCKCKISFPHFTRRFLIKRAFIEITYKIKLSMNKMQQNTYVRLILKPIWAYEVELWDSTKRTNLHKFQFVPSKILRSIANTYLFIFVLFL